jgi:hypothetical protein
MSEPKATRFEHRANRRNFVATWHGEDDPDGVPPGWNVVEMLRDPGWKTPVAAGLTTRKAAMDAIRNEARS